MNKLYFLLPQDYSGTSIHAVGFQPTYRYCHICSLQFQYQWQYNLHNRRQHSDQEGHHGLTRQENEVYFLFNCRICGYGTNIKGDLVKHERIHSGHKPYQCSLCSYNTTVSSNLARHYRNIHVEFHCKK